MSLKRHVEADHCRAKLGLARRPRALDRPALGGAQRVSGTLHAVGRELLHPNYFCDNHDPGSRGCIDDCSWARITMASRPELKVTPSSSSTFLGNSSVTNHPASSMTKAASSASSSLSPSFLKTRSAFSTEATGILLTEMTPSILPILYADEPTGYSSLLCSLANNGCHHRSTKRRPSSDSSAAMTTPACLPLQ